VEQHHCPFNLLIPNCRQLPGFGWRGEGHSLAIFRVYLFQGRISPKHSFSTPSPGALLSGSWQRSQWTITKLFWEPRWLRRAVCDRRNQQMGQEILTVALCLFV